MLHRWIRHTSGSDSRAGGGHSITECSMNPIGEWPSIELSVLGVRALALLMNMVLGLTRTYFVSKRISDLRTVSADSPWFLDWTSRATDKAQCASMETYL